MEPATLNGVAPAGGGESRAVASIVGMNFSQGLLWVESRPKRLMSPMGGTLHQPSLAAYSEDEHVASENTRRLRFRSSNVEILL
jgi:hypothetical protein